MNYIKIFFITLLFVLATFQIGKKKESFIYKEVPQEYSNRILKLSVNNLIQTNPSYTLLHSLPLNCDKTGKTDYTDLIQSILDKHDTIIFPDFPLLINFKGLSLKSNSRIFFKGGSKLVMASNSKSNYEVLRLHNVTNVIIYSPTIIGDRNSHNSVIGEWGFGISIKGSKNVSIYNAKIQNCWGDGIYIGSYGPNINSNIKISGCLLDNNRRNGISIISGINVDIDDCLISNTHGTLPMSGIDIEPNNNFEFLKNINIVNTVTFNNKNDGILIVLRALQGGNPKSISINIKNHIDDSANYAISFGLPNRTNNNDFKVIGGSINVINSAWKNNRVNLVRISDYVNNILNINFINIRVLNKGKNVSHEKLEELKNKYENEKNISFIL